MPAAVIAPRWSAALAIAMTTFAPSRVGSPRLAPPVLAPEVQRELHVSVAPGALEISGCEAITRERICEVGEARALRVWLATTAEGATFRLDDTRVSVTRAAAVQGGTRFDLVLPTRDGILRASVGGAIAGAHRIAPAPPVPPAIAEARALRARGELDLAAARLHRDDAAEDEALASGALARIALAQGRIDDAAALFTRSIEAHARDGHSSRGADDAFALVFARLRGADITGARAALERARPLTEGYPDGRADLAYYEAELASRTGDLRRALRGFREAADRSLRLGITRLPGAHGIADVLDRLGRTRDAVDTLLDLDDADTVGCERANLEQNIGWVALHERDGGHVDARAWLLRALETYRRECAMSYNPAAIASTLGSLARAELTRGSLDQASARLREAERAVDHPPPSLMLEWAELRGDLALARKDDGGALAAFDRMRVDAESLGDRDALRAAHQGRAEALARRGARPEALLALAAAGEIVDAQTAMVPLGEGRESFLRAHERSDARRIELLVSLGRADEAFRELRAARSRLLDALAGPDRIAALGAAQRARWEEAVGAYRRAREQIDRDAADDWRYSAKSLAERRARRSTQAAIAQEAFDDAQAAVVSRRGALPVRGAAGQLALAYFAGERGWLGFAVEEGHVHSEALGAVDPSEPPEALSAKLLAPFRAEIERARRIDLLAYGDARRVDVHALPFANAPLVARVAVVYPLDRAASDDARSPAEAGRAVIVGDPTSDLHGARAELDAVTSALATSPAWSVNTLRGLHATSAAVRDALTTSDFFHYSGHAEASGRDGIGSALALAEGGELSVIDVLTLPRAPSRVLLFGCDTARESSDAHADGLGLAQAFVIAGAREVIATTRPVDDEAASAIARELYAELARGTNLADALRAAQLSAWSRGITGWEAFRAIVR